MRNLLRKALLILLLLSVVIPSNVQANLFTGNGKLLSQTVALAVMTGAGATVGVSVDAVQVAAVGGIVAIVRAAVQEEEDLPEIKLLSMLVGVGAAAATIGAGIAEIGKVAIRKRDQLGTEVLTKMLKTTLKLGVVTGVGTVVGVVSADEVGRLAAMVAESEQMPTELAYVLGSFVGMLVVVRKFENLAEKFFF